MKTMQLPMSIILDVALGLILLTILYNSWQRGFLTSLIRLAGTAAGFLLASFLNRPAAEYLYENFLEKRVEDYVANTLLSPDGPLAGSLAGLDHAGAAAAQVIAGFLSERGLDFYSPQDAGQMGADILNQVRGMNVEPAAAIAQVAIKPLVMTVLQTAIFFLVIFLVGIVVRMVAKVGLGVNRIPILGGMNRLAGLLCGAVYALLVGYVVSSLLVLLAGLGGNRWEWLNSRVLQDTVLISRFLSVRIMR